MKDICCIGHVTKDKIVTPNRTVYMAGGTSFYFAYAINQLPKDVSFSLITAMDPTETEPVEKMRQAGIEVTLNPSRNTVFFENIYGENQNERKQRVLAKADPFTIRQLEHVEAKVYHLGSLLSDDFSPEVVEFLSRSGRVSIDVQGYLREVRDEKVYPIDWKEKLEVLKNTYYLKVNETEMETITGLKEPREAAKLIHSWGVTEVIITLGSEGSLILWMIPSMRFLPIRLTRWWMLPDAATLILPVISTSVCRAPLLPRLASLRQPCAPSSWSTTVRSTAASRM